MANMTSDGSTTRLSWLPVVMTSYPLLFNLWYISGYELRNTWTISAYIPIRYFIVFLFRSRISDTNDGPTRISLRPTPTLHTQARTRTPPPPHTHLHTQARERPPPHTHTYTHKHARAPPPPTQPTPTLHTQARERPPHTHTHTPTQRQKDRHTHALSVSKVVFSPRPYLFLILTESGDDDYDGGHEPQRLSTNPVPPILFTLYMGALSSILELHVFKHRGVSTWGGVVKGWYIPFINYKDLSQALHYTPL